MNAKDLKGVLPPIIQSRVSTIIWGYHGVGKSQIVRDVTYDMYGETNEDGSPTLVDLRLGQLELSDLTGIPRNIEINGKVRTVWGVPQWWPEPGTRGVLFMDEMNRAASPDMLQASFQLVLDHKIHTHRLPTGWTVISANNPEDDGDYTVHRLDPAMRDRFLHLIYNPTVSDWNSWADGKIKTWTIREFVIAQSAVLGLKTPPKVEVTTSPRSLEFLDRIMQNADEAWIDRYLSVIAAGLIGHDMAALLVKHMKSSIDRIIPPLELLDKWETHKETISKWAGTDAISGGSIKNVRADLLKAQMVSCLTFIASELKSKLTKHQKESVISMVEILPLEVLSSTMSDLAADKNPDRAKAATMVANLIMNTRAMDRFRKAMERIKEVPIKTEAIDDNPF